MNIAKYFSMDGDKVYCNDICGLMEELQVQHAPEQRRLFNHSSEVSLKAVLLHNGNRHSSLPLHMKETYANIQGLLKIYITKTTSGTCADLKVVAILTELTRGYMKFCCFLCQQDSQARDRH